MTPPIELDRAAATAAIPDLATLLVDAVAGGASVGFLHPLDSGVACDYWTGVVERVGTGAVRLLVVREDAGAVVGTVQLAPVGWPNGRHRAEVLKLLVHSRARRRGLGTELMRAAEALAREQGCTLLVLDTITGSGSERLYRGLDWQVAGEVPDYAAMPDGVLAPTTVMYRRL